jgi:hypothetical protein
LRVGFLFRFAETKTPMSNKQQTAVKWLIQKIESKGDAWENASIKKIQISIDASEYAELKAQAKEMEKEQMDKVSIDWFVEGCSHMKDNKRIYQSFEQYYKETFNK